MAALVFNVGDCKNADCSRFGICKDPDAYLEEKNIPYLRQIGMSIQCISYSKKKEAAPGILDAGD